MNYRHQYHAGNFADVFKHVLLLDVWARLQRKEKGILYLDTHAGRGVYDLAQAGRGESLERRPEHPEGWGRLAAAGSNLPDPVYHYARVVREFQAESPSPHFYPGSPRLIQRQQRAQDRLFLCERHPEEAETLQSQFSRSRRVTVQTGDGYRAVAATLPPPERRALVLIDPPYESTDEFGQIEAAVAEGLRRLPGACFMVWYPLSRRAGSAEFLQSVAHAKPAPAVAVELKVAGAESGLPMWGSGLLVLNPPYQAAAEWAVWLPTLSELLRQGAGAGVTLNWCVSE